MEERVSSHSRGILRPSCVAVSRLGFIGDYGLSHAVITGDWYGARHHPVRRIFWTEHGEDGERARAIFEALRDRRRHRPHQGGARCGGGPRWDPERHPDRRERGRGDSDLQAGDLDRRRGDFRRIHPEGVPGDAPGSDRERTECRRGAPRIPERRSGIREARGRARRPSNRCSKATIHSGVEAVQRPVPEIAVPPDSSPGDGRGDREADRGAPVDGRAERGRFAGNVRCHGSDRLAAGFDLWGSARLHQSGLHGRRARSRNRPRVRRNSPEGDRGRRPGEHLPSRLRLRDAGDHHGFNALRNPDDARTGAKDAFVPSRRRRVADARDRARNRVAPLLHTKHRRWESGRDRNQPREYDEGGSRGDRADLRKEVRPPHRGPLVARLRKIREPNPADPMKIPRSHPRYDSLVRRERLVRAWKEGIAVPEGLIAHGRGEAWDYLFGEETSAPALVAERAAAAHLLAAERPVISVNGNVAALAAREVVQLARAIPARMEVNLFHRTEARMAKIVRILERAGARDVLGKDPNARIPGIESKRALSHRDGVIGADVVLVPLEDGDRAEALVRMKKVVISVDLNPLSRTSQRATIPIVDELTRAILNIKKFVEELRADASEVARIRRAYRRNGNLGAVFSFLEWRLTHLRRSLFRGGKRSRSPKR